MARDKQIVSDLRCDRVLTSSNRSIPLEPLRVKKVSGCLEQSANGSELKKYHARTRKSLASLKQNYVKMFGFPLDMEQTPCHTILRAGDKADPAGREALIY